jgi:CBS domain-containing protein
VNFRQYPGGKGAKSKPSGLRRGFLQFFDSGLPDAAECRIIQVGAFACGRGLDGRTCQGGDAMNVAAILKAKGTEVVTIDPAATLGQVTTLLSERRIGAVVVMQDRKVLGIVSERDVIRSIARIGAAALTMPVREAMTSRIVTCSLNDSIDELMDSMTAGRFRHLPVIESGELVGIVSIGDVVKNRIAETVMEAEALKLYIATG